MRAGESGGARGGEKGGELVREEKLRMSHVRDERVWREAPLPPQ